MKLKFVFLFLSVASILFVRLNGVISRQNSVLEAPPTQLSKMASGHGLRLSHRYADVQYEEKAKELASLLRAGEFHEIETQIDTFIQQKLSNKGGFYYPDVVMRSILTEDMLTPSTLEALDQWNQSPTNPVISLLMRSDFYRRLGWRVRGNSWWHKVPEENREPYFQLLQLSLQDLTAAQEIDPLHPLVLISSINIAKEIDLPRDTFDEYFTEITTQIPSIPQVYQDKSQYLLSKGSEKDVLDFIREATAEAPRGSAVPIIVSQTHQILANRHKNPYFRNPAVWADIESSMQRLVEDFPEVGLYSAWYAELAHYAHKDDIARQYMKLALKREPNHPEILQIQAKIKYVSP